MAAGGPVVGAGGITARPRPDRRVASNCWRGTVAQASRWAIVLSGRLSNAVVGAQDGGGPWPHSLLFSPLATCAVSWAYYYGEAATAPAVEAQLCFSCTPVSRVVASEARISITGVQKGRVAELEQIHVV